MILCILFDSLEKTVRDFSFTDSKKSDWPGFHLVIKFRTYFMESGKIRRLYWHFSILSWVNLQNGRFWCKKSDWPMTRFIFFCRSTLDILSPLVYEFVEINWFVSFLLISFIKWLTKSDSGQNRPKSDKWRPKLAPHKKPLVQKYFKYLEPWRTRSGRNANWHQSSILLQWWWKIRSDFHFFCYL